MFVNNGYDCLSYILMVVALWIITRKHRNEKNYNWLMGSCSLHGFPLAIPWVFYCSRLLSIAIVAATCWYLRAILFLFYALYCCSNLTATLFQLSCDSIAGANLLLKFHSISFYAILSPF
uniref:Uncharacterized protein n=1 Tax=Glossina palpalis gambiensis TaxID=67801 RepID=A0A1B0B1I9_9MUSC